jgi:hypothetical protein
MRIDAHAVRSRSTPHVGNSNERHAAARPGCTARHCHLPSREVFYLRHPWAGCTVENKDAPLGRAVQRPVNIVAIPILSGESTERTGLE